MNEHQFTGYSGSGSVDGTSACCLAVDGGKFAGCVEVPDHAPVHSKPIPGVANAFALPRSNRIPAPPFLLSPPGAKGVLMIIRFAILMFFAGLAGFGQSPLQSFTFGGSGNDSARGVAVDAAGNIYVVGTTSSADLTTLNAGQAVNSGTQVIYSQDAGATWKPLSNPFPVSASALFIAVDPSTASTVYAGTSNSVCRSVDAGLHFQCVQLSFSESQANISSLAVDPQNPSTIYASATGNGGVFKSTDGGQTWAKTSNGLPGNQSIDSVTVDPFHSNVIYAWAGGGGYVSRDGALSWTISNLPFPPNLGLGGVRFSFDPVTPGILYGPGFAANAVTVQKSTDGGQSWTPLTTPFHGCCVVPDPKVSGVLYVLLGSKLWKSTDGGATWNSMAVPSLAAGTLAIDPANTQILLAGDYRSIDGGQTWTASNASRAIQPVFAPSATGTAYAIGASTSDAFVAKFRPDGKTLIFLTYFGGMGNEVAGSIALDGGGAIWIAGSTSSVDLPGASGAFQKFLQGQTNGFVAKFTNDGKLAAASYLGASGNDSLLAIALSPQGNLWVIGNSQSPDFPFTTRPSTNPSSNGFVAEFDPSASQLLYSNPVDGSFDGRGKAIAIDGSGNVIVAGTTTDPAFPVTTGAYHVGVPASGNAKAFVSKLDPNGNTVYSTSFGGSQPVIFNQPTAGPTNAGIGVATDVAGNAYVTGTTSTTDFPTTSGAYQTALAAGCPYPAFISASFFSVITNLVDDTFILKLSPDGKTPLYSTLLGGSCYDRPASIAVDGAGNAYVAGETDSFDFPLVAGVVPAPAEPQFSSFVSELNAAGTALKFSTYVLAGAAPAVASGPNGSVVVAGSVGLGAQSQPFTNSFHPNPVATDSVLVIFNPPAQTPPVNLSQVRNAFSLQPGPIAPGEIVALALPGFAPVQPTDAGLNVLTPLTTNSGGVQVFFDGKPAFVMTVDYQKVVCIVPAQVAGQTATQIQASVNGQLSNVLNATVADTALGLLSLDQTGTGQANARNADGTLNGATNPATAGTKLTIFFTGAGVANPAEPDGMAPSTYDIAPAAAISLQSPTGGTYTPIGVHSLPGFVPGLFDYDLTLPVIPGFHGKLNISVSSTTSTSQSLYIYIK